MLVFESVLPCPSERVAEFHASAESLALLSPPGTRVEVLSKDAEVRDGALHVLRIRRGPFSTVWKARISEVGPHGFTDTAEQSPFAFWRHRHEYLSHPEGTLLRDTVEYSLPFGPLGRLLDRLFVGRQVKELFAFRHAATRRALEERAQSLR